MYTIKTLNAISPVGLAKLPANQFEIDNEAAAPQGILVRSADMHDTPLPDSLLAIARAGAGTNNIPVEDCTNKGIVVFNTPGANANAVAELVVGALVAGSRNLVDAVNWAQTLKGRDTIAKDVEKGKKAFVGPELRGKTLGVIGLGAIGARVANAAVALGMEVLGYDPVYFHRCCVEPVPQCAALCHAGRYAAPLRLPDHPCPLPAYDPPHHQRPDAGDVQGRRARAELCPR